MISQMKKNKLSSSCLSFIFVGLTETVLIWGEVKKEYMLQILMGVKQILGKQNSTFPSAVIFLTSKEMASVG